MKKAVIVILLIVIAILVFLLVRNRPRMAMMVTNHPYKNTTIKLQQCPARVGKDHKVCIIPIEYLLEMTQPGGGEPDNAIEVRHKDTILWVSWSGESITVNPMDPIDCTSHQKIQIPGADPFIDKPSGGGNAKYAHVTDKSENDNNCYKTNITVTTASGVVTTIDPHLFDGGP